MAVSYRETVIQLLKILSDEGGYRDPCDQAVIARARTLIATNVAPYEITVVVSNIPLCPSRLELAGDITAAAATKEAVSMRWWSDGTKHVCPVHEVP